MSASIRSRYVSTCRAQVGYIEGRGNITKFAREAYPSAQGQAWCGTFAAWGLLKLGIDVRTVCWIPYVPYIEQWARKNGAWKTREHLDGDLVIYDWNDDTLADHVGIVWRNETQAGYRAIEGNTSPTSHGSQSNGGGVHVRYRGRKSIRGWVDLEALVNAAGGAVAIDPEGKASGALEVDGRAGTRTIKELQRFLDVPVDGRAGPATFTALERNLKAPYRDGIISRQSYRAAELGNGIVAGPSWEYTGRHSDGSPAVKLLQKRVGVKGDGIWHESTSRGLQKRLNTGTF